MNYLLGFDCGATNIECALANVDGNILNRRIIRQPANILVNGVDSVSINIISIIDELVTTEQRLEDQPGFNVIVIGAAGAGRKTDAESLQDSLINKLNERGIIYKKLIVVSDAQIALEASFPSKPGCILIAGTGSIIYGKDDNGTMCRAGGFGRLIGDEGSGYSIGRKALNEAAKDFNNGINNSKIIKLLIENYSIKSLDRLLNNVYKKDFDIASVARHVIDAAEQGDNTAKKIMDEESDELVLLIKVIMDKMNVDNIDLSFNGSLIDNKNFYSDMLKDKISYSLKTVTVTGQKSKPVDGAIFIAKEMLND